MAVGFFGPHSRDGLDAFNECAGKTKPSFFAHRGECSLRIEQYVIAFDVRPKALHQLAGELDGPGGCAAAAGRDENGLDRHR